MDPVAKIEDVQTMVRTVRDRAPNEVPRPPLADPDESFEAGVHWACANLLIQLEVLRWG